MKTTESTISQKQETILKEALTKRISLKNASPLKSVRPQKSMMRVQSLRPRRLKISKQLTAK